MKWFGALICAGTKGSSTFQYLAMCAATINIICSGLHYGWSSPSLPKLLSKDSHIPTTADQGSWIAVMFLLGAAVGSVLVGFVLDKFGRKNIILLTSVPFFVSWMMMAFAQSVDVLLAARFIAGLSDGLIFCAVPMYIAEIAEPGIRGFLGSSITVALISGILLINIIGFYFSIRTTALISSAVPVLLVLTFLWMPESPYYLLMKNKPELARRSLVVFRGTGNVEPELERLAKAVEEQNANTGRYLDLFTVKSNRRALYVMMGTRAAQQWSGITAFTFYAQTVFKEAGDSVSPIVATIIYYSVQILFSGICSMVVDKTGRRPLMIMSIIGASLVLLIEASYFYIKNSTDVDTTGFSLIPIIALIVFVILFSMGMQSIPLLLLGELFPTNVKAFALSYADLYLSVITATVSKFFQFTKDSFGMHVPFFVFAACGLLGLLFVVFFVPETKGRTLERIQQELKGEAARNKLPEKPETYGKLDSSL